MRQKNITFWTQKHFLRVMVLHFWHVSSRCGYRLKNTRTAVKLMLVMQACQAAPR
jgi:hypothetical protein